MDSPLLTMSTLIITERYRLQTLTSPYNIFLPTFPMATEQEQQLGCNVTNKLQQSNQYPANSRDTFYHLEWFYLDS